MVNNFYTLRGKKNEKKLLVDFQMKRQIIKEFASIDSNQSTEDKESLTSILVNNNSPVCDFLIKKIPTANYNHLKTFDAWNRRIGNVTLKELENTKAFLQDHTQLYKDYEASLLKPQAAKVQAVKIPKTDTRTEAKEIPEETPQETSVEEKNSQDAVDENEDTHLSLSDVDLTEKRKEEIQEWYTNALEVLQSQKESLRSEQFRRRKAQLRVEYWAKMDKEINKATPTVVMF